MGIGLFIYSIHNSNCYKGQIYDVDENPGTRVKGGGRHSIIVKFKMQEKEIIVSALSGFFVTSLFKKQQITRLRKKYIGKQVHIYYWQDKPLRTLIREFMWRDLIDYGFMIVLGVVVILASAVLN